jgi:hypothetical protein
LGNSRKGLIWEISILYPQPDLTVKNSLKTPETPINTGLDRFYGLAIIITKIIKPALMPTLKVLWVSPDIHRKILKLKADKSFTKVEDVIAYLLKNQSKSLTLPKWKSTNAS